MVDDGGTLDWWIGAMEWWLVGGRVMSPLHQIMSVRIVFGGTCDDSKLDLRGYTKTITIAVGHVHEQLDFQQKWLLDLWFSNRNANRACTNRGFRDGKCSPMACRMYFFKKTIETATTS